MHENMMQVFGVEATRLPRLELHSRSAGRAVDHRHQRPGRSEGPRRPLHHCRYRGQLRGAALGCLFRQGEGVPPSLRGLHAWLAHFSEPLSLCCIAADPYAVLGYGDSETLSLDQARSLLSALKQLSERDPYFRSENWGWRPASGLMRLDLREEIFSIVENPDCPAQLRLLLLETMAGTLLATELSPTLEKVLFDPSRYVEERSAAAEALHTANAPDGWEPVIKHLLGMTDPHSPRLALEILQRIGLFGVSRSTSIHVVLAYFGLSSAASNEQPRVMRVPESLFEELEIGQLASWLDDLVESIRPLMTNAHFNAGWRIMRMIRSIAALVLEFDPAIEPARVWKWIDWLNGYRAYNDESSKLLEKVFEKTDPCARR